MGPPINREAGIHRDKWRELSDFGVYGSLGAWD